MIIDNTNVLNSPVRSFVTKVELYKGSALADAYTAYYALKSFTIERLGEESKFFGYGICQKMNMKLVDKDRLINITTEHSCKNFLSTGGNLVSPYPMFYVTEVNRDENTNELSVTAYDKLYDKFAGAHTVSELNLESYTVREFAEACATLLGANGIEIVNVGDTETCFDTSYETGANFEGTESIRDALNAIAEATQTIYYLNNDNNLVFKRLDRDGNAVLTIGKADYIELDSGANRRFSTIVHATELGDNVSASTTAIGSTQYVRDNPFWELRDDIGTLVDNALAAIGGLTINQFECNWRGNFLLEIGDKINLITKDNKTVTSYILDDTIEYSGGLSEKTRWSYTDNESETASNPTTLGEALKQTYARVDKANKQIELVASETSTNSNAIGVLQINTDSISSSVTKLEKDTTDNFEQVNEDIEELSTRITQSAEDIKISIKNELEQEGVTSITTETGFTFNKDGLTVSKNNSGLTTTITEDGMIVKRDNTPVLTADNTEVNAMNLHATTYLFVGVNSRFQDYADNTRTGCFWIGK